MSEIERIIKDTLVSLEQELSSELMAQGQTLAEHQKKLTAQDQDLKTLKDHIGRLQQEQREGERLWEGLSNVYRNLEPLLSRLNAWLNTQGRG